jgi:3-phosphoshikimate 1-carboxyvinyltransferase
MLNTDKQSMVISPARALVGNLRLPGDKSISHRYAMLAATAAGRTHLQNFSTGADCASTLGCVEALGCRVERKETDGIVDIEGVGPQLRRPSGTLDCGNSGSTIRMLSGIVAAQPFVTSMSGDESLSRRPMKRVIDPLTRMGATIESEGGRPPLRIYGGRLHGIEYATPVASAQVKTCVLFAGLLADGQTVLEEPVRTRDHGELALRAFGAQVWRERNRVGLMGGQKLTAIDAYVPGDISTAAFFLCAAALLPGSDLIVGSLGMNPTRAVILDVLTALGARISVLGLQEHHGELVGNIQITAGKLRGATIEGATTAGVIDELPVLAAIAPYTDEGVEIKDAQELRVKESDRIAAVATNLRAMGATVEETETGLRIPGGQKLHGAEVDSFGDHRIAMAFAIAALRAEGQTLIHGADAARISYPEFFTTLDSLAQR